MGLIETGKKAPSFPMIERIAAALEIDSPFLFVPADAESTLPKLEQTLLEDITKVIHDTFSEAKKAGE